MKHEELVKTAVKWLYDQGCGFAIGERVCLTGTGEIPDAIGFRSGCSILVECKTSRSDFKADRKKKFRFEKPELGMGNFRFYMCVEGVISPLEVPVGWGLLYANGNIVKKIIAPTGNTWSRSAATSVCRFFEKNLEAENAILYSCLRRMKG